MRHIQYSMKDDPIPARKPKRTKALASQQGLRLALLLGVGAITFVSCASHETGTPRTIQHPTTQHSNSQVTTQPQINPNSPFPGTREVIGVVEEMRSDQIKIDTGDLQPRYLSAKYREKKGFAPFKLGDQVVVTLNPQNQVVDAHLAGEEHNHKILRGKLAQSLTTGQEKAVIKVTDGGEESYMIKPLARAKVAGVPVGVDALFLVDEASQIADVTYADQAAARKATAASQDRSPLKNPFERTPGVLSSTLKDGSIGITTESGGEETYKVRPLVEPLLKGLSKGSAVILMLDDEHMVTDVAIPPGTAN
ncbi:MAG: exported protein of unknown function [Nitrospira sp.]|nr:exported protein of unknown function [Nitrospira sp.]MCE3224928.1 exported protein of unknown function [Nitrospira sp.]MDF2458526.1 exported protein of unknown function [Nitrospira sp.]